MSPRDACRGGEPVRLSSSDGEMVTAKVGLSALFGAKDRVAGVGGEGDAGSFPELIEITLEQVCDLCEVVKGDRVR